MVSSSYDGTVRLWSLRTFTCLHIFEGKKDNSINIAKNIFTVVLGYCIGYNFYNCIITISEPESLVRCLAFVGPMLSCGDFGGSIHTWELEIASQPDNAKKNPAFKVRYIKKGSLWWFKYEQNYIQSSPNTSISSITLFVISERWDNTTKPKHTKDMLYAFN